MFFSNMQKGNPLEKCPDNDQHNVDTIDAFNVPIVAALATAFSSREEAKRTTFTAQALSFP